MTKRTKETLMGIIVLLIITTVIGLAGHIETHYTRKDCVVVEVEQGLVTVLDTTGNEWCYYMDSEDYTEVPPTGTKVDLKMFTAYTDNTIEDDEIVKVVVR
jgi:hypothetical protein